MKRSCWLDEGMRFIYPKVIARWGMDLDALVRLMADVGVRQINKDYVVVPVPVCVLRDDLECLAGFRFIGGKLCSVELYRKEEYYRDRDVIDSYHEFDIVLKEEFGSPAKSALNIGGYCKKSLWRFSSSDIEHNILERFVFEEHLIFRVRGRRAIRCGIPARWPFAR